jgi:hypothetical protein
MVFGIDMKRITRYNLGIVRVDHLGNVMVLRHPSHRFQEALRF